MKAGLPSTFEALKTRFRPAVVTTKTTYYLSLGDGPDEKWTVTLAPSGCIVTPGKVESADCVLKMPAALFVDLVAGKFKPGVADFMSGKIKTSDITLLETLQQAFGL